MEKLIDKIGFFRLVHTPLGFAILLNGLVHGILLMALIGAGLTYVGLKNRCPLGGSCDIKPKRKLTQEELAYAKKCREERHVNRVQRKINNIITPDAEKG